MSLVNAHNEWDPLEEMIVGVAENARVPSPDPGLFALDYCENHASQEEIPTGPYDQQVVTEAHEDLEAFVDLLKGEGVTVRRPAITDHAKSFGTPDWSTDGEYNYCPRDVILPIGQTIIETPMALRSRFFEPFAYKEILLDYFKSGAKWISAPKPRLLDDTYHVRPESGLPLANLEPVFDAANVMRVGKDILYLVSCSGNELGGQWLQQILGDEYRVHFIRGAYEGTHIDTTIMVVRPGLVVLNPERIREDQIPPVFKNWDIIWAPEMGDTGYAWSYPRASIWQGMNFIMVRPDLAVINDQQGPLIQEIEKRGIEVAPLKMRQARTLSGGFHCVSVDVRRRGTLEDYSA
ncbi:inosamine-phosphate amidinotransferase 1 [Streptomyces sp. NBC_01142]|uniref:inosamine-phosphate amidinotransferase 1 n=1 Tax=Streptomyces sp. NBC_01142 TaxID=2975865 RepID=UPI00225487F0|nr:inosamine-phosphate amidinotransferase 1 [Streptomyces sp. NBC_01142]MCX4823154.1 inosamine-phosphate amidinotransferase 1 [Streptomyces sp. NBC_01142]